MIHHLSLREPVGPNPSGLCQCGCGQKTNIAKRDNKKRGHIKGQPIRFIRGHQCRSSPVEYLEEDRGYDTPCWVWQRGLASNGGYARIRHNGVSVAVHRLNWQRKNGPVPEGMELDHLCRVRVCVNPDHLEPVTHLENVRRGKAALERVTHCPQGHPYDEVNTYRSPGSGHRQCRTCMAQRSQERYRARLEQAA